VAKGMAFLHANNVLHGEHTLVLLCLACNLASVDLGAGDMC
jgi:hypothetical protein